MIAVFIVANFDLNESRIYTLVNISRAYTTGGRSELNEQALGVISDNPLFGDFASWQSGEMAHNFLSLFSDFGLIIGTLWFLGLLYLLVPRILTKQEVAPFLIVFLALGFFVWYGSEYVAAFLGNKSRYDRS